MWGFSLLTSFLSSNWAAVGSTVLPLNPTAPKMTKYVRKRIASAFESNARLSPRGPHPHQVLQWGQKDGFPLKSWRICCGIEVIAFGRFFLVACGSTEKCRWLEKTFELHVIYNDVELTLLFVRESGKLSSKKVGPSKFSLPVGWVDSRMKLLFQSTWTTWHDTRRSSGWFAALLVALMAE